MASEATRATPAGTAATGPVTRAVGFRRHGAADVLEPLDLPVPEPAADELVVRVAAAGVNPADALLRSGRFRFVTRRRLPFVPGGDVAGVVQAVGATVTGFRVGQAVYAMLPVDRCGGYAGQVRVAAHHAAPAPAGLSLGDAAAMPLAALTALQALSDRAGLRPGADLLVYGASGGVGHFAVQIGVALGARVTAVTSARNAEFVAGLGAAEVVDYERTDPVDLGSRFDVVLDAVDKFPFRRSRRLLRPGGVAVTVRPFADKLAPDWLAWTRGGRRLRALLVQPSGAGLGTLAGWVAEGRLRPEVEQRFALADAAAAHRRIESGRVRGKLVLTVDEDLAAATPGRPGPGSTGG